MFAQQPEKKTQQSGFTLIELAIIMAIIAVLGAVGAVKFASMKTEADSAALASALANARSALAIAVVKDPVTKDGKVAMAELDQFLEGTLAAGTAGNTLKWSVDTNGTTNDFTITYEGSATDITGITSVSK